MDRNLAVRALPSARTAEERGRLMRMSEDLTFFCYVGTSDSTISGEAESADSSVATWRRHYAHRLSGKAVEVSAGDVHAISTPRLATVYVPCALPSQKRKAAEAYSLSAEARTIGTTRAKGDELRQLLVDFAYQLARHAYRVGECQEPRSFPESLPRLSEGRVPGESLG